MVAKQTQAKEAATKTGVPQSEASAQQGSTAVPQSTLQRRRVIVGIVVSDKMQKTIVVKVDRRVKDPLYKKYLVKSEKYKAHDEKNEAKVGDRVSLVESRPLSRDKRWVLQSIIRRASQAAQVNV